MKRWKTNLLIIGYLGALSYGIGVHALRIHVHDYLANYFVVWDMYCGWSAFETRSLLVAEGESGQLYDATPPWQEIKPYGSAQRHDYDMLGIHSGKIAVNTLNHTSHEPIKKIYQVEKIWSKRYNLPDHLWSQRYDEPKQPREYYYIRSIFTGDGAPISRHFSWGEHVAYNSIIDNPALRSRIARARPYLRSDDIYQPGNPVIQQASFETTTAEE